MAEEKEARLRKELALAILLWKFVRHTNNMPVNPKGTGAWVSEQTLDVAFTALDMAKQAGVTKEFLEVMMDLPVLNIQVKQLEKWDVPDKKVFNPFIKTKAK